MAPPREDAAFPPEDTFRILLATDNHIGYNERDPIRGQDSVNTFGEILQLAKKHQVDFVLLAGDLFHENKPSRESLYRTIALLREYTMGDNPVQIDLLSDPADGKAEGFSFPAINYEDPNLNVGIPVFSIHGNHDDPQGAGAEGALGALDVLSVSGLVNYMGKIDLPVAPTSDPESSSSGIAVRPVLLRKGKSHLGMYGIGNVKDTRMHFELRSNRVRMFTPRDKDNWFNLLLVHQNRVKHGPQDFVPEGMFDDCIDLVVWGHEHDCRIIPEPVTGKNYYISQPGSSVATSLADGEALPKHVALLSIHNKEYKMEPIPLRTVRPFVLEEVVLSEIAEEEDLDLSDQIEISKFLKAKVNALIDKANEQWEERNVEATKDGGEALDPMLPLVRLKVDTTGVSEMSNPIRFGQEFQGRIANPRDMLVFHRTKKSTRSSKVTADEPELSIDDPDLSVSEKLAKVRVATLVQEYLSAQELQLLGENGMSDAIQMFVEKDDIHAIQTHVARSLKSIMKDVQAKPDVEEENLDDALAEAKEQQDKEYKEKSKSKGKGKAKARANDSDAVSEDSMMMDVDVGGGGSDFENSDDEPPKKAPAKKAPAKKAPAKKAPAKKAPAKKPAKGKKAVSESEGEVFEIPDDDDDDDIEEEEEPPKPAKKTNRAAVLTAKKAPAKKTTAKQSQLSFQPAATGRSSRAAASKARGRMVVDDDSD
ncbi:Mre11 DNA-binding presumed domain-containing protein [Rhodocollybia butyracea]|uniref:Double-strand break repair protein n=1 Tax=Rhodocollybia butyracea TaxID=206335 RepID=A0A9P5QB69_9AGAR|nr:Mre11 DNA-binding presumed domain-containing protein [Rhodocollybia butyracea]